MYYTTHYIKYILSTFMILMMIIMIMMKMGDNNLSCVQKKPDGIRIFISGLLRNHLCKN